jgi:transcriptional regulator with XRE-family HTH domain
MKVLYNWNMTKFRKWLERAMFDLGGLDYRQADLARDLGVSQNTISSWLNGDKIGRDSIYKLAVHFGKTSRAIYELLGEPAPDGLNDDEEIKVGLLRKLARSGNDDGWVRSFLEKAANGELSNATRELIIREIEQDRKQGVHGSGGSSLATTERRKTRATVSHGDNE